jgi:hypothetical protein
MVTTCQGIRVNRQYRLHQNYNCNMQELFAVLKR